MDSQNKKVFPQANDFNKFFIILNMDEDSILDNIAISKKLNIHVRQVEYYKGALNYFDLYDIKKCKFTNKGIEIRSKPEHIKIKRLIKIILADDIFFDAFYERLFIGKKLVSKELGELLYLEHKVDSLQTAERRGSTVKSWIEWILETIKKGDSK